MRKEIDEVRFDPALLVEKRRRANAARGELLTLVQEGLMSAWDAVTEAASSGDEALLKITLEQLVMTQPGVGQHRARRVVEQVIHILEVPPHRISTKDVTLGYVIDGRSNGRRMLAVLDAFISHGLIADCDEVTVWPGFPYSSPPVRKDTP